MKIGPISVTWQGRKALSSKNWLLDQTPEGVEENFLFNHPELLTSHADVRDALNNKNLGQDIKMKRNFERFAYIVALPWIFMLISVVLLQGFELYGFKLESAEFITVVTTTTGTVIGLAYIVGNYLFGQVNTGDDLNQ